MKNIFKLFVSIIAVAILGVNGAIAQTFPDVNQEHWAYEAVEFLYEHGVIKGYPDGNYVPDAEVTRAEFCAMVVSALRLREKTIDFIKEYKDVPQNHWAHNDIRLASFYDLVLGTPDGFFYPSDKVTRAQVISVVMNSLSTNDITQEQAIEILSKYPDAGDVPAWALLKTAKAVQNGLMYNTPGHEHTLEPNRNALRGELAMFIYNMMNQVAVRPAPKLEEKKLPVFKDGYVIEGAYFDEDEIVIPAGTILPLGIYECIDGQHAKVGDAFQARAHVNFVNADKILLIPVGKMFNGKITKVQKPLRFIKNAHLALETDEMLYKDGTVQAEAHMSFAYKKPEVRKIRHCPHLTRIRHFGTKTQKLWIHKSQEVEFTLLEPVRIKILDNYYLK